MKPIRRGGAVLLSAALALLINATPVHAQDRGKAKPPADFPTLRAKVSAYEADKSITVETPVRGGGVKTSEFSIVKDKTQIELGTDVKAIEVGMMVSVWAEKDNPKNAARIATQAAAAPGRNRGGSGAVPENAKPAAPTAPPAPRTAETADVKRVLDAKDLGKLLELIKPVGEHELAWREIPWMTDIAKARQKAADEGKMLIHWSMVDHPLGRC